MLKFMLKDLPTPGKMIYVRPHSKSEEKRAQVNKNVTQHRKVNRGVQTELNMLSFPGFMIIIMQTKFIVLFWHKQGERNKTKKSQSPKLSAARKLQQELLQTRSLHLSLKLPLLQKYLFKPLLLCAIPIPLTQPAHHDYSCNCTAVLHIPCSWPLEERKPSTKKKIYCKEKFCNTQQDKFMWVN